MSVEQPHKSSLEVILRNSFFILEKEIGITLNVVAVS